MGLFTPFASAGRWPRRPAAALALLALLAVAGCKQAELADLDNNMKRQVGTWQIAELRTVVADSLGTVLSTVSLANQGSITFQLAANTGANVFNLALFDRQASDSEFVGYFKRSDAGNPTTSGGWALYWDADPADLRLQFWGIQPGGSLHRVVNLARDGDDSQRLTYIVTTKLRPGQRTFYTFELRK